MTAKGCELKQQGCLLGHAYTCSALDFAYQHGHGVAIDKARAYGFFAIACVESAECCKNRDELAAFASPAAIRTAKLRSEAKKYDAKPAPQVAEVKPLPTRALPRNAEELYKMGNTAYEDRDFVAARDYYNKSCLAGRGSSCGSVVLMLQNGQGGKKNLVQAFAMFTKGCDANGGFFCKSIGDAYANGEGVKKNVKTAKQFYKKACGLNDQVGCVLAK